MAAVSVTPGPISLPQRDLLGRRIASSSSISSPGAVGQAAFGAAAAAASSYGSSGGNTSGSGSGRSGWMLSSPGNNAELAGVVPLSARGSIHYKTL